MTRPRHAVRAKSAMVAMAERRVTAQSGERLWSTTLFTGQVRPQATTTMINARRPWPRALEVTSAATLRVSEAAGHERDTAATGRAASRRAVVRSDREQEGSSHGDAADGIG